MGGVEKQRAERINRRMTSSPMRGHCKQAIRVVTIYIIYKQKCEGKKQPRGVPVVFDTDSILWANVREIL